MNILTTSTDSQTIEVIPRRRVVGDLYLILRNESTNDITDYTGDKYWNTYDATFSGSNIEYNGSNFSYIESDGLITISNDFDLTEDTYYTFVLRDDSGKIFKGIIFCTNQTIDQSTNSYYKVNKNQYVTHSADNEFIIL